MILHTTKLLDKHKIMLVMFLQIIFSQVLMTTGLPQIDNSKKSLCMEQTNELKSDSINPTMKEAYQNCKDKVENFKKIINVIERQPTKDVKDLAYNALYQEVLNHYKLESSETTQINLCILETLMGKKEEALEHFKGLNPNAALQVVECVNDLHGVRLTELLKFVATKPEVSDIGHNIIIISVVMAKKNGLPGGLSTIFGIKLMEIGAKLQTTKLEPSYFNKLQEIWEDIIITHCDGVQNDTVTFTTLKDLPSHVNKFKGNLEKVENYFQDILFPSIRTALHKDGVKNHFDMILKCVPKSIPFIETGAILYSIIFDEIAKQNLSNTNDFKTKLADYIKNYMELPNYSLIDKKYKEMFENLKTEVATTNNNNNIIINKQQQSMETTTPILATQAVTTQQQPTTIAPSVITTAQTTTTQSVQLHILPTQNDQFIHHNGIFFTNGNGTGVQLLPTRLPNGDIALVLPTSIQTTTAAAPTMQQQQQQQHHQTVPQKQQQPTQNQQQQIIYQRTTLSPSQQSQNCHSNSTSPLPMLIPIPTRTSSASSVASSSSGVSSMPPQTNSIPSPQSSSSSSPNHYTSPNSPQHYQQHRYEPMDTTPTSPHHHQSGVIHRYSPPMSKPLSLVIRKTSQPEEEKPWRPW